MTNQRPSPKGQPNQPTGTSGRQDGSKTTEEDNARSGDTSGPSRRVNRDDDEDSLLGNRTTYR